MLLNLFGNVHKSRTRTSRLCVVGASSLVLALSLSGIANAQGTLLSYEGFDYTPGQTLQNGLNGGKGWAGNWFGSGPGAITGAGLTYPGAMTTGGGVSTAGSLPAGNPNNVTTVARFFTAPLTDTNTYFLSYLLQPNAGSGFYGGLNLQGSNGTLFIGKSEGQTTYGLQSGTSVPLVRPSSTSAVQGQPVYLVLRATLNPGADQFDLYINPTDFVNLPASPNVSIATTDGIDLGSTVGDLYLNNYGGYTVDEIRVGKAYGDITGTVAPSNVPEPGAFALFTGLGMTAIGFHLRRKR
ncbi:MAG: hypothetical protein H7308_02630 [Chthonomonadaceae bacterium]|nr:hypothetical protein [Chthonomonadaceae bacterium]